MLNRLAKEHATMAGGIVLRQEPSDQSPRLNDRHVTLPLTNLGANPCWLDTLC